MEQAVEATDTLTPEDAAAAILVRPAGDSLTVTDTADAVHSHGAPDSLTLSDTATVAGTYHVSAVDNLIVTDGVDKFGPRQLGAVDLPSLYYEYNDPVEGWIGYATLVLDTAVAVRIAAGVILVAATDNLALTDTARRGPNSAATDTLTLTHAATVTVWQSPIVDAIALSDTAATTVILDVSGLDNVINVLGGGESQQISVVLDDHDGTLKAIMDHHDIHKRPCWVYQWFEGLNLSDKFLVFKGEINSPLEWSEGERTIRFDVISRIEDVEVGFSIEEGRFPVAPEDLVGKPWPLVFGTCINVPALRVQSPFRGVLGTSTGIVDFMLATKLAAHLRIPSSCGLRSWGIGTGYR